MSFHVFQKQRITAEEVGQYPDRPHGRVALVLIHGIGDQQPMNTLRDFINGLYPSKTGEPHVFSKPDRHFLSMIGHHVAIRVPDFEASKRWFVEKLDFRVHKVWTFKNRKHAYLTPATDETLHIEILGGAPLTRPETRPARTYVDLKESLRDFGYHHFCLTVDDIDKTITELHRRGVAIVEKPFDRKAIQRRYQHVAGEVAGRPAQKRSSVL